MQLNTKNDHETKPKTKRKPYKRKSTKNQGRLAKGSIARGIMENPLTQKSKNGQNLCFRCNLVPMLTLVNDLYNLIRPEHLQVLARTPFGKFFMAFYEKKLNRKEVTKTTSSIIMVMNTYCPKDDAFNLGGKLVKLTVDDVALTFGLPKRGKKIIPQPRNIISELESEFMRRQFHGVEKLNKAAIMTAMKKTLLIKEKVMEEDFARLVVLYMAVTIFFPNSLGSIGWSFVQHIEDLDNMNRISWSAVIHEHLMKQVRKHHKKPIKASGCVIQLLYWLCEHVNLISPIQGFESNLPRVARWSLNDLSQAVKRESLERLPKEKISINLKNLSEDEMKLLAVEVHDAVEVQKEEISEMESLAKENEKLKDENLQLKEKVGKLESELERFGRSRNGNTRMYEMKKWPSVLSGDQQISSYNGSSPDHIEKFQSRKAQDDENLTEELKQNQKIVTEESESITEIEKETPAITSIEDNNRVKRQLSECESNMTQKKSKRNKEDEACKDTCKDSFPLDEFVKDAVQEEEIQPEISVKMHNLLCPKETTCIAHISEEHGKNIEKSVSKETVNMSPDSHQKIDKLKEEHLAKERLGISLADNEEHKETISSTGSPESDPSATDAKNN